MAFMTLKSRLVCQSAQPEWQRGIHQPPLCQVSAPLDDYVQFRRLFMKP